MIRTPQKPTSPRADWTFGELLDWHFFIHGTRPEGDRPDGSGRLWNPKEAAGPLPVDERQFQNWLNGQSAPRNTKALEGVLFGDSDKHKKERDELRTKLREFQLRKAQQAADGAGAEIEVPATEDKGTVKPMDAPANEPRKPGVPQSGAQPNKPAASVEGISVSPHIEASPHITVSPHVTASPQVSASPHASAFATTGNTTQQQSVTLGVTVNFASLNEVTAGATSASVVPRRRSRGISPIVVAFTAAATVATGVYVLGMQSSRHTGLAMTPGATGDAQLPPRDDGAPTDHGRRSEDAQPARQQPPGRVAAPTASREAQDKEASRIAGLTPETINDEALHAWDKHAEAASNAGFSVRANSTLMGGTGLGQSLAKTLEDCAGQCSSSTSNCTGFAFREDARASQREGSYCERFTGAVYFQPSSGRYTAGIRAGHTNSEDTLIPSPTTARGLPITTVQAIMQSNDPNGITRCTSGSFKVSGFELICDRDAYGGVILGSHRLSFSAGSINECSAECGSIPACVAFAYHASGDGSHGCHLFGPGSFQMNVNHGWVSGLRCAQPSANLFSSGAKTGHFQCMVR